MCEEVFKVEAVGYVGVVGVVGVISKTFIKEFVKTKYRV